MIVAAELGYQLGRRQSPCDSGVGAVKASVLALVGLLLAFTYSIAAAHYDRRKQVVIDEAVALKTCWLHADFADEPARSRARELIRSIVDTRLQCFIRATGEAEREAERQVVAAQNELWSLGARQMHRSGEPDKHALLARSVGHVIERSDERAAADEHRVPAPIICLLVASVLVSGFLIGLLSGRDNRRIPLLWALVIGLMVGVLTTTIDLDSRNRGFIPERPKPLEDLKAYIETFGH
jgi:hypothetical protein